MGVSKKFLVPTVIDAVVKKVNEKRITNSKDLRKLRIAGDSVLGFTSTRKRGSVPMKVLTASAVSLPHSSKYYIFTTMRVFWGF
jgi:hypothetical protein